MSFLSDLVEGNFSNLGTDLSHAPESAVTDYRSEWPIAAGIGGLALGGLGLGLAGAGLAGDAAFVGGDIAAGGIDAGGSALAFAPETLDAATAGGGALDAASLDAANAAFGPFDPALFDANVAATEISPFAADLGGGAAASDLVAGDLGFTGGDAALGAGAGAIDPITGAPVLADVADVGGGTAGISAFGADPAAFEFAPLGGDVSAYGAGDLSSFAGSDANIGDNLLSDLSGTGSVDTGTGDLMSLQAPGDAGGGGAAQAGGFGKDIAGLSSDPLSSITSGPPATTAASSGGGFLNDVFGGGSFGMKDAAMLGLAGAPLALALFRGEAQLPTAAQQAQGQASALGAYGQQQLAAGTSGVLNAGQMAMVQQFTTQQTNQALQNLYNMGVKDPTKDSRWPAIQADIQVKADAMTQTMLQQEIQNGLTALGTSGTQLNQVAQMQMASDTAFTNTLVNATSSAARVLATGAGGTKTVTTTTQ